MSETFGSGDKGDAVRDEVRLDLDEDKLDTWEDVRGDYAVDPESDVARPAVVEGDEGDRDSDTSGVSGDVADDGPGDGDAADGSARDDES
ncbi:hypothetical protein [Knoellia aerolata]|uniref:Uncharacterized protein n=1 Tax=Knoellia aerolata DSM 18566 TaxID=1385519 RepID=A0A0A0JW05_9MICO|nr:hypothetical protein [Knoellia aerolata]KGN40859.1 hypothetical protein N801_10760 [Knoellia aerolata DSM 18566]